MWHESDSWEEANSNLHTLCMAKALIFWFNLLSVNKVILPAHFINNCVNDHKFHFNKENYIKLSIAKQFAHDHNIYATFAINEPLKADKICLKYISDCA
jgi:hypothetical protein